ncbi:MAG TPA: YbhB/YbcL family Raf kinase inhibitor-like protein [Acidimicrobiales bacterium]
MPGDAWRRAGTARGRAVLRARVVIAAGLALMVAACGGDGRALRPPSADQTTTTTAAGADGDTAVDAGSATGEAPALQLTSPGFAQGGEIPVDHTCQGADVPPALMWAGPPEGAVELALVVRDVDADGFVHWVVAGIPPGAGGLEAGALPGGAVEAANDFGRPGWAGPCPPSGRHHYELRLYALGEPSGVTGGQPGGEAAALVEGTPAVASAVLSGWVEAG